MRPKRVVDDRFRESIREEDPLDKVELFLFLFLVFWGGLG